MFHAAMGFLSRVFGYQNAVVVYASPSQVVGSPSVSTLPAVVRAIQLLAADLARLPMRIVNSDGTPSGSPIAELFTRDASRWQSGYEFRRFISTCALTTGNGLALIRRAADGSVAELQPLPNGTISAELTEDGMTYRVGNIDLTSDQVIHIGAYPDPANPAWFVGPLDAAQFSMRLASDQESAHAALIKTGSTGKIALQHQGAMSDQTVQAIKEAWSTMHATADGAGRPLILREGMTATKISSETSTTMIDSRKFSIQEIARAFGVPPEMLFQQGGGALASQSETARAYVDGGLAQWVAAWESEITRKLCAPGEFARFDTDILLRGNLRDAGMGFSKLVMAGVMSPNDARKRLGLEELDGFDTPAVSMPGATADTGGNPDQEGDANA